MTDSGTLSGTGISESSVCEYALEFPIGGSAIHHPIADLMPACESRHEWDLLAAAGASKPVFHRDRSV